MVFFSDIKILQPSFIIQGKRLTLSKSSLYKLLTGADVRYVGHQCRRAKIALSLVFLKRKLLFCSPTQLFDVPLDPPLLYIKI